jgi:gliding motility-associated-like protein
MNFNALYGQACSCVNAGNCPLPITDNGIFNATLDVNIDGPNDLGQCPLTTVCFTIQHTWVGDLAISLTSPAGLHYLVMADISNVTGGCGNMGDNIEVCIVPGVGNPLTNNTEYTCTNSPCSLGNCCVVGNWTMPCGGVTDPMTGAIQAPNCNLNDFNVPGHPANGTWTLTVNEICNGDVGLIQDFTLNFACPTESCIVCDANAGVVDSAIIRDCVGGPALNFDMPPFYPNAGDAPDTVHYDYGYLLVQNGIITSFLTLPNLTNQPAGLYHVYGFSFFIQDTAEIDLLIGMPEATAESLLNSSTAPFCGHISDTFNTVQICPAVQPTMLDSTVCQGTCIDVGGQQVCASGPVVLNSFCGCDSVVNVNLTFVAPQTTNDTVTVCAGGCVTVGSQQYCAPGPHTLHLQGWQHCDSTVILHFNQLTTTAVITPANPPSLSCTNGSVMLNGSSSQPANVTYAWSGPNNYTSNQPSITVSTAGTYTLTVSNNAISPACTSSASATVNNDPTGPNIQVMTAAPSICQGQTYNLGNVNVVDQNMTNPVITFHPSLPATTANQLSSLVVSPADTTTFYILAKKGTCSDLDSIRVNVKPIPTANFDIVPNICQSNSTTITYTGTAPPNAAYTWTYGGGAASPGYGQGPQNVQWSQPGLKAICLFITLNGCVSPTYCDTVIVESFLQAPIINCTSTLNSVLFSWHPVPNAAGYSVMPTSGPTGVMTSDTSYLITGMSPNQQACITVNVLPGNSCPGNSAMACCEANDCPPTTLNITPVPDICLGSNVSPISLTATQSGGSGGGTFTWSGPGVINGQFDPAAASIGANTITVNYEENTCQTTGSTSINVWTKPTADFTMPDSICETDVAMVNYTGNASVGATFAWDFDGGSATPGIGQGPHAIQWSSPGAHTVTLTVTQNGCISDLVQHTINVKNTLSPPVISCDVTTSSIEFNWNHVPGATSYNVTVLNGGGGVSTSNTSWLFSGLNPGDQATIQVEAINPGLCGNVTAQQTCTAQNCPNDVQIAISPVNDICLDANTAAFNLSANVTGGAGGGSLSFSGNGITNSLSGAFDPKVAGVGSHVITALYEEGNCRFTQDITINIYERPVAAFTLPSQLCQTDAATIDFTGNPMPGAIYTWNFDGGNAAPGGNSPGPHNVTWGTAGAKTISLTVQSADGCVSAPVSQVLQISQELAAPGIACNAGIGSVNFAWNNVAGATSYTPSVMTGQTGVQSGNSFTVQNLQPGESVTLELTVSGNGACPPVSVQQTCAAPNCPPVTVDIAPVQPVCLGAANTVQLSVAVSGGNGSGAGAWSGFGVTDIFNGIFNPAMVGAGQHTISYTYLESGCTFTDDVVIVVNETPEAAFLAPTAICQADSATVTFIGSASASADFAWDFDGGIAIPGVGVGPHKVYWQAPGNHTIRLFVDDNGCLSDTASATVATEVAVIPPAIICQPTSASVHFSWTEVPGQIYTVQPITGPPGTFPTTNSYLMDGLSPGQPVAIQVTASSANSVCQAVVVPFACSAEECKVLQIEIEPLDKICLDDEAQPVKLVATVTGGSGNGFGVWSGNGVIDPINGLFDPEAASLGLHTISYTYQELNCPYQAQMQAEIVAPPHADAGEDAAITCRETEQVIELGGVSSTGPNITYQWTAANGAFPGDASIMRPKVTEPGVFTLRVTNTELGCSSVDNVNVTASNEIPVPEISTQNISCFGKDDGEAFISNVVGGSEPYLFSIDNQPFTIDRHFGLLVPGDHELVVIDAGGCEDTVIFSIEEPIPLSVNLELSLEADNTVKLGEPVYLHANVSLPPGSLTRIDWSPDEILSCDSCLSPVAHPVENTRFFVTVGSGECEASAEAMVFVKKDDPIYVPNAFSPNGDGINDLFVIYAGGAVSQIKTFLIFDRWGETVFKGVNFEPNNPYFGWDGMHRGAKMTPAVFTWFAEVELEDGTVKTFDGDLTLVR